MLVKIKTFVGTVRLSAMLSATILALGVAQAKPTADPNSSIDINIHAYSSNGGFGSYSWCAGLDNYDVEIRSGGWLLYCNAYQTNPGPEEDFVVYKVPYGSAFCPTNTPDDAARYALKCDDHGNWTFSQKSGDTSYITYSESTDKVTRDMTVKMDVDVK